MKSKSVNLNSVIDLAYNITLVFIFNFILIDGLLPQIRENILPFPIITTAVIKAVMVFFAVAIFFLRISHLKKIEIRLSKKIFFYYGLFMSFLVISALIQLANRTSTLSEIWATYNNYYFSIIVIPLFSIFSIKSKYVEYFWIVCSIPIVILGFAQHYLSDPILPTTFKTDPGLLINSWQYYGDKVRAFSLFTSGLSYGRFLSLLTSILIFKFFYCKKNTLKGFILLIFFVLIWATYTTLTRNIYLESFQVIVCSLVMLLAVKRYSNKSLVSIHFLKFLPIINGLLSLGSVLYAYFLIGFSRNDSLLNSESIAERFGAWPRFLSTWDSSSLIEQLFGVGIAQEVTTDYVGSVLIDNNYVALLLNIGVIGLILWILLMWNLWSWMFNQLVKNPRFLNPVHFAVIVFWCTWISSGLYTISLSLYPLFLMLVLSWRHEKHQNMYSNSR
jgi:hypothetical protein